MYKLLKLFTISLEKRKYEYILTSIVVRQIFQIVNEESPDHKYKVMFLESIPPPSNRSYTPYRVMKAVCGLVREGARMMVRVARVRSSTEIMFSSVTALAWRATSPTTSAKCWIFRILTFR